MNRTPGTNPKANPDPPGDAPTFVVVGHVNRGKSSVVATLAADDSVRIDSAPGTTRENQTFPMRLNGRVLYTLIDTPGFERARQALHWLRENETTTHARRQVVERFVRTHAESEKFEQECRLLKPILDGGAILYVVDGSTPFNPAAEAEMEILRWTGQPRMALINPIAGDDAIAQWHTVLDQYFSLARVFNAHEADFARRIALLTALRELHEPWGGTLDEAIAALRADRQATLDEAARRITDALIDLLTEVEQKKLNRGEDAEPHKQWLHDRFLDQLRQREQQLRGELRALYGHHALRIELADGAAAQGGATESDTTRGGATHSELPEAVSADLFDRDTWSRLGLSRRQLAVAGAAGGAVVGGGIDLATGGASLLIGSLLGAGVGGAGAWFGWGKLTDVRVFGQPVGGDLLRIGPVRDPQFAWVVLDRALLFHDVLARQPHARRETITVAPDDRRGRVARMPGTLRKQLEKCFARLRKQPGHAERETLRRDMPPLIRQALDMPADQADPSRGDPAGEADAHAEPAR